MRLNINKKIFFVILFFLFFVVINNKCFASINIEYNNRNYTFANAPLNKNFILCYNASIDTWFIYHINNGVSLYMSEYVENGSTYYSVCTSNNSKFAMYIYNFDYNRWDYDETLFSKLYVMERNTPSNIHHNNILYSTVDIFTDNTFTYKISLPLLGYYYFEIPTLYIDDMNFRKRFGFQFYIPLVKEDTKYYVFLEDYNRISYSSVSASFRIFTVTTPEGYDYTDYENYMYYDNLDKKLYFPAGCEIKEYSCSGVNGDIYNLTLENEFISQRELQHYGSYLDIGTFDSFFQNSGLGVASLANIGGYKTYLYSTDFTVNSFDSTNFFLTLYNALKGRFSSTEEMLQSHNNKSYSDYFYNTFLHSIYYNNNSLDFGISDLCFSSSNISSYENMKSLNITNSTIYNFFRNTNVFDYTKNWLGGDYYSFQYTDSEDVSSMLPNGTSVEYLTSPFYKENENSSSGGYITYDINEILQGDKIIDYSKEDNSIHNNFNGDYIENYQEGDNIVINNYYTNTIDKTSDSNLLHNIYLAILEIKLKLSDIGNSISNTTNNFTYNTENNIKYYFVPNSYVMDNIKQELEETAEQHLGIIYQPFQRYSIYFHCDFWNSNK